jgi:hypothetical protein
MINLSMTQALEIWDELRDCLEGKNRYGGDTAEIYAYRLSKEHLPLFAQQQQQEGYGDEAEFQIAASLTNLVQLFCATHDCIAIIECSGVAHNLTGQVRIFPQAGRGGSVPPFCHRAHVTISRA